MADTNISVGFDVSPLMGHLALIAGTINTIFELSIKSLSEEDKEIARALNEYNQALVIHEMMQLPNADGSGIDKINELLRERKEKLMTLKSKKQAP